VSFEILNGSTTTVSFQFETDGEIITMGSGGLAVAAKIDELAPICVPLGSDCGEGRWCPPAELTGAQLACRYAGAIEPVRQPRRLRRQQLVRRLRRRAGERSALLKRRARRRLSRWRKLHGRGAGIRRLRSGHY
jgi:hypothetical protein